MLVRYARLMFYEDDDDETAIEDGAEADEDDDEDEDPDEADEGIAALADVWALVYD